MNEVFIVEAKRTPIGKIGGVLRNVRPEKMAATLIRTIVQTCEIPPHKIDEVILGNVVGPGGNLARLSSLTAGLPVEVPGVTIDRQCGSGQEAINIGARLIQSGGADLVLAGGVESTSLAPWKMEKPRNLHDPTGPKPFGRARFSPDEIGDPDMGVAAENVAEHYEVTRDDQDRFALHSHEKAVSSQRSGRFRQEIVPIGDIDMDECPREDTSLEKLSRLKPVFREDGSVTAGNACPVNDGAAIVLLASKKACEDLGLQPAVRFIDACSAGVDPNLLGIGPIPAVGKLLDRQKLSIEDIDLVEFNEAFASQVLASIRVLGIREEIMNVGGGALALGHPYGASGAILMTRMFHEMKFGEAQRGLITLGIGGGLGLATLVEKTEG